ncbi:MAG: galactonate dehydratase [Acidiphilium sp. 37-64-53]|uniref:UxaA family hydrolase n=1 Tax=Acidiphilium TaxID=522 RepID=UPI000BD5D471|nr:MULTISPECIES: altronate dehydratase family protein [Acidiphilium]OYW03152.1 MAG: galactonate dehydratase [Acidiphilium sp. 37-64-53]HQT85595.1 altronate dehydratase family protein [Acidiphilium rubrum]
MTRPATMRLHHDDNVLVALEPLASGSIAAGITAAERIPRGHKMASTAIAPGAPIHKFGQIIGFAGQAIAPGAWVHEHNVTLHEFDRDYQVESQPTAVVEPAASFQGFRRANGRAGTRNYIAILSSVNCAATVARQIVRQAEKTGLLDAYPNIDGIVPLTHGTGCGMAANGEGFETLERTLWGTACNPNIAAVLFVGLGCEVFQIARMKSAYGIAEGDAFRSMTIQESGGTPATIAAGLAALRDMAPIANAATRTAIPASELVLALQCGGSDAYSGLTANPALGAAVDSLVRQGGTAILSETPEIYGAEHLLVRRAASQRVADDLLARIDWWRAYVARTGDEMNNNPSPGNKAGGLTTILEKSLGAVAKGGSVPLSAVVRYAEPVTSRGLVFMDTPGYDPVSATGQVAGGANILCFTTGRGSAFGCKPVPSLKLATNSDLYRRMESDMDIDCGDILDGVSIAAKGQQIFDRLIEIASGAATKSEILGYGDNEFVPWQIGAVM